MSNFRVCNPPPPRPNPAPPRQNTAPAPPFVLPAASAKPAAEARAPRGPARADSQAGARRRGPADAEAEPDLAADAHLPFGERAWFTHERTAQQEQRERELNAPSAAWAGATASLNGELAGADEIGLCDALAQMSESGIFEVLLPGGQTLGVAVDVRAAGIGFLLSPSDDRLRARLQAQQMELEDVLKRRMGCSVKIAVL